MNFESYFLSFARLARRSAVFWGHAVTSGVSAFDGVSASNSDDLGTTGREGRAVEPHEVGGIDYFVSSWLFEDNHLGRLAQRKYSERSANNTPKSSCLKPVTCAQNLKPRHSSSVPLQTPMPTPLCV